MSQSDVHYISKEGFTAPEIYDSARPSYPSDAVDILIEKGALLDKSLVVDLGAGTGKLTCLLADRSVKVTAVEPSADMRRLFLEKYGDRIQCLDGTASQLPFNDGEVDSVVIAQAFHWFANETSMREIHRVLKPGGSLCLIWNMEDDRTDWVAAARAFYQSFEGDAPQYRHGTWRNVFNLDQVHQWFTALEHQQTSHIIRCTYETVWLRARSKSYITRRSADEQSRIREQLMECLVKHLGPEHDPTVASIDYPYTTDVFWCYKRE